MTPRDQSDTELLSLAVHELRTPAGVVGGYLRMLQRDSAPLSELQRKMVDEAERSCQRLVALVAELSEIQKLDADLVVLAQQELDAFCVMAEAARGVHEADERNVHLEIRGKPTGASMRGDITRLQAALAAVFRACLREAAANTTVVADRRLDRRQGVDSAVLIIADEASVDVSYEAEPVPFDENRGGLGLALPIARRVIERHRGRVWSPAGGRAAAIISLPLSKSNRKPTRSIRAQSRSRPAAI
jgi:signal transduction histidine kinase